MLHGKMAGGWTDKVGMGHLCDIEIWLVVGQT